MFKNQVKSKKSQVNRMRVKISCVLLFTWLFLLGSFSTNAQETPKKQKIGLVLSGGGAKGLAHIGVLKIICPRAARKTRYQLTRQQG